LNSSKIQAGSDPLNSSKIQAGSDPLNQSKQNKWNLYKQIIKKYGSDYFDENTEEVVRGKRPDEVEPEQQDTFYDGPSEEDWPKQASIKLMVKVAQKLDSKKKYKLADKFTNILRKYNV
jgi:hypothetical protein